MNIYSITFLMLLIHTCSFSFHKHISIFAGPSGGHSAVTQSLIKGLQKLNIPFDYNNYINPAPIVVVLAHIDDLKRAINLKKQGKIKKLLAGPNLMIRSNEFNGLLAAPEIDICIVPSDWVAIAYEEDMPTLKGRIATWFAGIDEEYWKPLDTVQRNKVLVYWKTESNIFCDQIEQKLKQEGFIPICIRYGQYQKEQFKTYLNQSLFAVFISRSESQGLALAEAWAMDVPTLVWNPQCLIAFSKTYSCVSAAPYLTQQTGNFWQQLDELSDLIKSFLKKELYFSPRKWVLQNCTELKAAQRFCEIIQS